MEACQTGSQVRQDAQSPAFTGSKLQLAQNTVFKDCRKEAVGKT